MSNVKTVAVRVVVAVTPLVILVLTAAPRLSGGR